MCGRFTQQLPAEEICDLYSVRGTPLPPNRRARYNGAPGQGFAACRIDDVGAHAIALLRWGLVPSWARDAKIGSRLINARSETVDSKPSFRAAFRSRRCMNPADGWFEWRQAGNGKQPYFLTPADGSPLSFAALWERWDQDGMPLETSTIITTAASPELHDIHHRQPAIIEPRWFSDWLDPMTPHPALLEIVREPYCGPFERRPVTTRVNSVRNDDPNILVPITGSAAPAKPR